MTKKPDNSGPAFPIPDIEDGMSLRQYYAGQALAGIMANPERWKQIAADYESGKKTYEECSLANATKAWSLADAMLATEEKEFLMREKSL